MGRASVPLAYLQHQAARGRSQTLCGRRTVPPSMAWKEFAAPLSSLAFIACIVSISWIVTYTPPSLPPAGWQAERSDPEGAALQRKLILTELPSQVRVVR